MYSSLSEKSNHFRQFKIDTLEGLQEVVNHSANNTRLRFRGVRESKFTMMTSLQRNCPKQLQGHQKDYLTKLLRRVKTNSDIIDYFKRKNIIINDISCLALMQHQGLPTPLLDFSTDIHVALSFAADKCVVSSGNDEIDKYASLYAFDIVYENEVGISIQQIYENGLETGISMLKEHLLTHPMDQIDASLMYDLNAFVKWSDIKDIELCYIEYQPLAPGVVTMSGQALNLSNPNLDRQNGCFVLNLYKEELPLEENWNIRTTDNRNRFWSNRGIEFQQLPFSGVMTRERLTCYDIKKEVIKEWAKNNPRELYDNSPENLAIKDLLTKIYNDYDKELE